MPAIFNHKHCSCVVCHSLFSTVIILLSVYAAIWLVTLLMRYSEWQKKNPTRRKQVLLTLKTNVY